MNNLVETILNEDFSSANDLFESRMSEIAEKKLYEAKRSIDITEVVKPVKGKPGEFTGQNTAKDWAKYRKQHPSLGMHEIKPGVKAAVDKHEKTGSGGLTKHGIAVRRKKGYLGAHGALKGLEFIKAVTRYHKTGQVDESALSSTPIGRQVEKGLGKLKSAERQSAGQAGEPYKAPEKAPSDVAAKMSQAGGRVPKVELEPSDVKKGSRRERLAKLKWTAGDKSGTGLKMLKAKSGGGDAVSRYDAAMKTARELQARGAKDAVSKLRWSKGGMKARATKEVGGFKSYIGGTAKRILQGLGEDTE